MDPFEKKNGAVIVAVNVATTDCGFGGLVRLMSGLVEGEEGNIFYFYFIEGHKGNLANISFGQIGDCSLFVQVEIGDPILSK